MTVGCYTTSAVIWFRIIIIEYRGYLTDHGYKRSNKLTSDYAIIIILLLLLTNCHACIGIPMYNYCYEHVPCIILLSRMHVLLVYLFNVFLFYFYFHFFCQRMFRRIKVYIIILLLYGIVTCELVTYLMRPLRCGWHCKFSQNNFQCIYLQCI